MKNYSIKSAANDAENAAAIINITAADKSRAASVNLCDFYADIFGGKIAADANARAAAANISNAENAAITENAADTITYDENAEKAARAENGRAARRERDENARRRFRRFRVRVCSVRRAVKTAKPRTMKNPLYRANADGTPANAPFVVRVYTARETLAQIAERAEKDAEKYARTKANAERAEKAAERAKTARAALEEMPADAAERVRYIRVDAATPADARAAAFTALSVPADMANASALVRAIAGYDTPRVYADLYADAGKTAGALMAARNVARQWIRRGEWTPRQYSIYLAARGAFRPMIDASSAGADFLEMVDAAAAGMPAKTDAARETDINGYGDAVADAEKRVYSAVNDYVKNAAAIVTDTRRRAVVLSFADCIPADADAENAADLLAALAAYTPAEMENADADARAEKDAERNAAASAAIVAAVAEMPKARRAVVEFAAAGASVAEIAAATRKTPQTVCGHLADARADICAAVAAYLTPAERAALTTSAALADAARAADKNGRAAEIAAADIAARAAVAENGRANAAARAARENAERAEKAARAAVHAVATYADADAVKDAERRAADAKKAAKKAAEKAAREMPARVDKAARDFYADALAAGYTPAAAGVLANERAAAVMERAEIAAKRAAEYAAQTERAAAVLASARGNGRADAERRAASAKAAARRAKAAAKAADAVAKAAAEKAADAVAKADAERAKAERAADILAEMDANARAVFLAAARGKSFRDIQADAAARGEKAPSLSTLSARLNAARAAFAELIADAAQIAPRALAAALNI